MENDTNQELVNRAKQLTEDFKQLALEAETCSITFAKYQFFLNVFQTLDKNTVQFHQGWNTLKKTLPLSVDNLAALEAVNHMRTYHAILSKVIQKESLLQLRKLKSTSYYLKLHVTTHGIKPERSKIFLGIFSRNHQESHQFNEEWKTFNSSLEPDASQSIRESINATYLHILQNHQIILEALLSAWEERVLSIFKDAKLIKKFTLTKTLKTHHDSWVSELPKYRWKTLYESLKKIQDLEWELLFLEPSQALKMKERYQNLKNQYCVLTLADLLSKLIKLKPTIHQLRYDSITYEVPKQNITILKNLCSDWDRLDQEFQLILTQWNSTIPLLKDTTLYAIGEALLKEHDALVANYYSLLISQLSILLKTFQNSYQEHNLSAIRKWISDLHHKEIDILASKILKDITDSKESDTLNSRSENENIVEGLAHLCDKTPCNPQPSSSTSITICLSP